MKRGLLVVPILLALGAGAASLATRGPAGEWYESPRAAKNLRGLEDDWYKYDGLAGVESNLRTAIERSPHREVRAQAMFDLAQWYLGVAQATQAQRLSACDLLDAFARDYQDAPCAEEARQYAELHPRSLVGKLRQARPHPPETLAVGQVAPDFEAEDQDGVAFHLKDYRGKVIALDFWGFW